MKGRIGNQSTQSVFRASASVLGQIATPFLDTQAAEWV